MILNPQMIQLDTNLRMALRPAIEARIAVIEKRVAVINANLDAAKGGMRTRDIWRMERDALEMQAARLADFLNAFIED